MNGASRKGLSGLMNNTVGIMSMGLISITLFYLVYRKGVEPVLRHRKMKSSEDFADFIYKTEIRAKEE